MGAMPLRDMFFWFFLTIFGTGTFVIFEKHIVWGLALIGVGLTGMVGCAWPYIRLQLVIAHYLNSRPLLIAVFLVLELCLFLTLATPDLHERLHGWLGFAAVGLVGAVVTCSYWWFAGKMVSPAPATSTSSSTDYSGSDSSISSDADSQYQLLNLSPQQKAELDKLKAPLFEYKAALLDMPEYYKARVAKDEFRKTLEDTERQNRCLIDTAKVECFPKPPAAISRDEVEIDISVKMVADELSKTFFWVIRNKTVRVRVPIALFVSLTNRQATPLKIDLLYLDARSVGGWADIRMADSLFPAAEKMSDKPLVLQAKNACASMKGEYLLPSLYDRIIQPGDKVEGWIIAEYPKGFKYGSSIGDMRISLLAGDQWIASKTFPANPRVYKDHPFEWYFTPLDTLITEEW
jgi:hypothetical protein